MPLAGIAPFRAARARPRARPRTLSASARARVSVAPVLWPRGGAMNRNVKLAFVFQAFLQEVANYQLVRGVFTIYIFTAFGGDATKVGSATASMGVAQLLSSMPAGWAADRFGRGPVLRFSAASFIPGAILCVALVILRSRGGWALPPPPPPPPPPPSPAPPAPPSAPSPASASDGVAFGLTCLSQALWGVFGGVQSPPIEAIFADSVESGRRSGAYVLRTCCRFLGQGTGRVGGHF